MNVSRRSKYQKKDNPRKKLPIIASSACSILFTNFLRTSLQTESLEYWMKTNLINKRALKEQGVELNIWICHFVHKDFRPDSKEVSDKETQDPRAYNRQPGKGLPHTQLGYWRGELIDGEHVNHLRFADIIIFASNTELQRMLNDLNEACQNIGFIMNLS